MHGAGFSVPGPRVAGRPGPCAQSRPSGLVVVRALPRERPGTGLSCLQGLSRALGWTGGAEGVGRNGGQAWNTGRGHRERLRRPGYEGQPRGSRSETRGQVTGSEAGSGRRGHGATQRGSCGPCHASRGLRAPSGPCAGPTWVPVVLPDRVGLHAVLGGKEPVAAGRRAPALRSGRVLQVLLGVNVEAAPCGEPGTAPWAERGTRVSLRVPVPAAPRRGTSPLGPRQAPSGSITRKPEVLHRPHRTRDLHKQADRLH